MKTEAVAAALIAGGTPDISDMMAYWLATDAGTRPKQETVAVLAALSSRPAEEDRIAAFVQYVCDSYEPVRLPAAAGAINIVGTGGGQPTFNISTTAAFVAAAAGARVLKSGSSAYSSNVGSGDILSALGLGNPMPHERLDEMLETVGIAFAPASAYAPICRRLAIAAQPLTFKVIGRFVNSLGPLICPFAVGGAVIGASDPAMFSIMRNVAGRSGQRVLCVHSELGVDELLSIGTNLIGWSGMSRETRLSMAEHGFEQGSIMLMRGGNLEHNVETLTDILKGKGRLIARQTVALNAGAVLHAAGRASDIVSGTAMALDCMESGAPFDLLTAARRFVRHARQPMAAAE